MLTLTLINDYLMTSVLRCCCVFLFQCVLLWHLWC